MNSEQIKEIEQIIEESINDEISNGSQLISSIFVISNKGIDVIKILDMPDVSEEKRNMMEAIAEKIDNMDLDYIDTIIHTVECWHTEIPKEEYIKNPIRPSEHPNRKEAIMATSIDKYGLTKIKVYPICRSIMSTWIDIDNVRILDDKAEHFMIQPLINLMIRRSKIGEA